MRHKNLVIYDSEEMYAKNLMERITLRKEISFQVRMFSEAKGVQEFGREQPIDLLLVTEECRRETRAAIGAGQIFVLTKGVCPDLGEDEISILKYQSADEILSQVLESCLDSGNVELCMTLKKDRGKIIGVYSPIHRIGKTKFALKMGKELAKHGPVLYLNMEEYAGIEGYFKTAPVQTMEDLLYYSRQEYNQLGIRISTMVEQMGELDYIHPMMMNRDLRSVAGQEWVELLEQILEKSIYETVIVDIGECIQGIYDILQMCDTVYTLYTEGRIAQAKLRQYEENLMRLGLEDILEHTVKQEAKG